MHLPAEAQVPGHLRQVLWREGGTEEVIVQDVASLERLLLHEVDREHGPSVRITGAKKLKILGYLGVGFPIVELGTSSFKVYRGISFIPVSFFKCAKATA